MHKDEWRACNFAMTAQWNAMDRSTHTMPDTAVRPLRDVGNAAILEVAAQARSTQLHFALMISLEGPTLQ